MTPMKMDLFLPAFACLGILSGWLYLLLLSASVRWLIAGSRPAVSAFATAGRVVLIGAVFVLAARQGAISLAAALAGFLVVRGIVIRHPETVLG